MKLSRTNAKGSCTAWSAGLRKLLERLGRAERRADYGGLVSFAFAALDVDAQRCIIFRFAALGVDAQSSAGAAASACSFHARLWRFR